MTTPENISYKLPRQERLRGHGTVATLFAEGESGFAYPIRYVWCKGGGESDSVLFTVPKRYHKRANRRNLLRRRLKEAYRLQRVAMPTNTGAQPLNIALIYSSKEVLEYAQIAKAVAKVLDIIYAAR